MSACLIFLFISLELNILLPSQQNTFYQSFVKGDSCMRDSFAVLYKCKHSLDLNIYIYIYCALCIFYYLDQQMHNTLTVLSIL